ncbi:MULTISPECIES: hypothetical protein [Alteromonadales]|uniref:Uncharacterized protein n=1 Tax=Corallincola holothuriorum TaxID=2282215 RepID=A0A368MYE1_9GAMM|nr:MULTISPECIES: hypothetical protein [Alteromonadales]RCU42873.1 hypothetical protein DU002_19150 [Corallincola holothuriorum]
MDILFCYRTYSIFGGNATLNVAGKWLSEHLSESYGGKIESVVFEFCARNVSPPRKTLEASNERFEQFLKELPIAEFQYKGTELRICTKLVKFYHDEVDRDSQVLSLRVFKNILNKSITLLESTPNLLKDMKGFDNFALAEDIKLAVPNAPSTLVELAELYLQQSKT